MKTLRSRAYIAIEELHDRLIEEVPGFERVELIDGRKHALPDNGRTEGFPGDITVHVSDDVSLADVEALIGDLET